MLQKSKRELDVSAWGASFRVSSAFTHSSGVGRTYVLVVPASGIELLQGSRRLPGLQKVIHLVLLPPAQGLAQHVPGLVQVEVSCPQKAQDVLIFRYLRDRKERRPQNGTSPSDKVTEMRFYLICKTAGESSPKQGRGRACGEQLCTKAA